MESLIFLVLMFGALYFLMIRPQQKKQRQHAEMLEAMKVDDDVVTIGGLHGTVVELGDESVDLQVTDDVVLRFQRSAIARVVADEPLDDDASDDADHTVEDAVLEDADE